LTSDADLLRHFYSYGRTEDRVFVSEEVFDWAYYLEQNPDLVSAGITDRLGAELHFRKYGIYEARVTHPDFDGATYIDQNPDLLAFINAGGSMGGFTDKTSAGIWHYLNYGLSEGREPGRPPAPPPPPAPPVDDSPSATFTVAVDVNDI